MELQDTIYLMTSKDYKDRLKTESLQLKIRMMKLGNMLNQYYDGTLVFKGVEVELLKKQLECMKEYYTILAQRANFEGVDLTKIPLFETKEYEKYEIYINVHEQYEDERYFVELTPEEYEIIKWFIQTIEYLDNIKLRAVDELIFERRN